LCITEALPKQVMSPNCGDRSHAAPVAARAAYLFSHFML
jgi:hypothetical protein